MYKNLVIGLGNCGTQIVKEAAHSNKLDDVKLYTIDSVTSNATLDSSNRIEMIPILSGDKNGSGRNRERGAEMFEQHLAEGSFEKLFEECANVKSPIVVITSSAGGTGSGVTTPLCKELTDRGLDVIPIIICPAIDDPDAFHINTNELMIELGDVGVSTYAIFRNEYGTADYSRINKEVVTMVEIIFGKHYGDTDMDSIDESDLDMILRTPGRFIAVSASAPSPDRLKRLITEKVLTGYQPVWTPDDSMHSTFMTAFSLTSPFASGDFETVFSTINERIPHRFDEYRNICNKDGMCEASIIVAGLPRAELKEINSEFNSATGISEGVKRSSRPAFMQKKSKPVNKPTTNRPTPKTRMDVPQTTGTPTSGALDEFEWE